MEVSIRRVGAATRIQAAFRGRLVRRELIDAVRVDFEEVMRRVEGPLRPLDLNAATPLKPWGELGWKSPRRLSPPSVLDLDMEISPDSDAGNDAADRAPRRGWPRRLKGSASCVRGRTRASPRRTTSGRGR